LLKATLKLRLHTNRETESILLETLRQSTACFNAVTVQGWETAERNGTRLHHATYKALRGNFPDLPSQLHCAARVKATEALKSVDALLKHGRKAGRPISELCPVRYDARSYWVKLGEGRASLASVAGRVCVHFNLCGYYRRYLDWKPCSADLCFDAKDRRFYLHVVVETDAPETDFDGILGVDLGITEIATDSEGNQYSGESVFGRSRQVCTPPRSPRSAHPSSAASQRNQVCQEALEAHSAEAVSFFS
jgi:putative transposase